MIFRLGTDRKFIFRGMGLLNGFDGFDVNHIFHDMPADAHAPRREFPRQFLALLVERIDRRFLTIDEHDFRAVAEAVMHAGLFRFHSVHMLETAVAVADLPGHGGVARFVALTAGGKTGSNSGRRLISD